MAAHAGTLPHVLREYALLADGERGILVGPRGDLSWMCFPRWHDDALFASLIGGRGHYSVTPVERHVWGGSYEPGSLIWRSRWMTEHGRIECREALALPARPDRAVVLRRILATHGGARVRVILDVCRDFGRRGARRVHRDDDGTWTLELDGGRRARWTGAAGARAQAGDGGRVLTTVLELEEGAHHDLVLVVGERGDVDTPDPDRAWEATEGLWHERVPSMDIAVASRDARHAYAVMSGLTSIGGGMVAAATTSLPERAGQGRSYDYRYVWIRDQCYAGQAVAGAGPYPLLDDAVRFVRDRLLADGPALKPAYTVDGDDVPDQRCLDLPGYPGGTDVVGNQANVQFQLDAFGEPLLLFAAAARHDRLDSDGWRAVEVAADAIERRWRDMDAGLWEIEQKAWTHSRLICVAGLRAVAALPRSRRVRDRWLSLAEAILADTSANALHSDGRWQRAADDPRPDASLLLAALRGAVPPDDVRSVTTLEAIDAELTDDCFCYRYRPDERPLGSAEGAFLLCGFMMSLARLQQGDRVAAARWFERNRTACGPPGLLAEEFDVEQRQLRGNLPQAFVHALLLECAVRLSQDRES